MSDARPLLEFTSVVVTPSLDGWREPEWQPVGLQDCYRSIRRNLDTSCYRAYSWLNCRCNEMLQRCRWHIPYVLQIHQTDSQRTSAIHIYASLSRGIWTRYILQMGVSMCSICWISPDYQYFDSDQLSCFSLPFPAKPSLGGSWWSYSFIRIWSHYR